MVLLHYLTMLAICHSFSFTASSVPGKDNPVADAHSRFQFQQFKCHPLFWPPFWQCFGYLDSEVSIPSYPRSCPFHQTSVPFSPTFAARTVVLTRMAPYPQQMGRLLCALLLYWQTTLTIPPSRSICQQYVHFTSTMAFLIL